MANRQTAGGKKQKKKHYKKQQRQPAHTKLRPTAAAEKKQPAGSPAAWCPPRSRWCTGGRWWSPGSCARRWGTPARRLWTYAANSSVSPHFPGRKNKNKTGSSYFPSNITSPKGKLTFAKTSVQGAKPKGQRGIKIRGLQMNCLGSPFMKLQEMVKSLSLMCKGSLTEKQFPEIPTQRSLIMFNTVSPGL